MTEANSSRSKRKPYNYKKYTLDEIVQEATNYSSRSSFKKGNSKAYKAAIKLGCLDRACSHMKPCGNYAERFVYILKDSKSVYAGITYNISVRLTPGRHKALSVLDEGYTLYVTPYPMPIKTALKVERRLIKYFRSDDYPLNCINSSEGGETGSASPYKWTPGKIAEEAKKHKSIRQFNERCGSAYKAALKFGIDRQVCSHMSLAKPRGYWSHESNLIDLASSCKTRSEFTCNRAVMESAKALGIMHKIEELLPPSLTPSYWTVEMVMSKAKLYPTKVRMLRADSNLDQAARRLGVFEQATSHMISEWDYKRLCSS